MQRDTPQSSAEARKAIRHRALQRPANSCGAYKNLLPLRLDQSALGVAARHLTLACFHELLLLLQDLFRLKASRFRLLDTLLLLAIRLFAQLLLPCALLGQELLLLLETLLHHQTFLIDGRKGGHLTTWPLWWCTTPIDAEH